MLIRRTSLKLELYLCWFWVRTFLAEIYIIFYVAYRTILKMHDFLRGIWNDHLDAKIRFKVPECKNDFYKTSKFYYMYRTSFSIELMKKMEILPKAFTILEIFLNIKFYVIELKQYLNLTFKESKHECNIGKDTVYKAK